MRANQNNILLESLIGKTPEECLSLAGHDGFTTRITREDGESYMITCDFKITRINLHLEKGLVVKASIG